MTGSPDITPTTIAAAAAADIYPVLFLKLELDSGVIAFNSVIGDISFGGDTYTGVGTLASIGTADEVSDLSNTQMAVTLSGLPNDLISIFFNEQYQGRRATLFLGYLDATTGQLIDTPAIIRRGLIDTVDDAEDKTYAITLTISSRFAGWNTAVVRRYNNATQQSRFGGDKGLQFIDRMANKTVIWGGAT